MFSILKGLSILCAATAVFASPIAEPSKRSITTANLPSISLNGWGGLGGLVGFDDFFGVGNFKGIRDPNQFIIVDQPVCRAQEVIIVQQQLVIIQEFAKQIILSQICDVGAQVIHLQQFLGGFDLFRDDIFRRRGVAPGFDRKLALQLQSLINADGSFNRDRGRFDFLGRDIGKELVVFSSDWDDQLSPAVADIAFKTALAADSTSRV